MRRVLLESPYAGDIQTHVAYAKRAMLDCLKRNEVPFAGHLLYTQVLEDSGASRVLGIECHLTWLSAAATVVVYTDYGISSGMQKAIDEAGLLKIPVIYREIGKNP